MATQASEHRVLGLEKQSDDARRQLLSAAAEGEALRAELEALRPRLEKATTEPARPPIHRRTLTFKH